ncbi:MAG: glycerol-3-phosphate dehydrogenase/oxidase [Cyclobacteriaceae bacterium]
MTFSAHHRGEFISQLRARSFDLLVIGGGITGAGIALDAATRGLQVALVEKEDFSYGTSSRSTKLIHGGLRYLKQLEFALVKEVGSERAIVHRLAPHLVVPEKMLLPLYERRGLGYWLTSVGLKIYDWLAGVKREDQRKMLTRYQALAAEPLLKADGVKGGAIYAEYRTDDARLTIEVMKSAVAGGACAVNYLKVDDFVVTNDRVEGVTVTDMITRQVFTIKATAVVNAAGPWVDELREVNQSRTGKQLRLTKGVHIVVPYHRLPVRQAIYFDVPDGRMIFAIPRGRVTYIGTTDTDYVARIDDVRANRGDVDYLIHAVNDTFPAALLTLADVESSWAGLRPLIHEVGKSASELSRKDEIFESPSGLISIAGGKLTGYRKMAERVVDRVVDLYFSDAGTKSCQTASHRLPGGDFDSYDAVIRMQAELAERLGRLNMRGNEAANLVHLYGRQALQIVSHLEEKTEWQHQPERALVLAKAWFAIHFEMAMNPVDFLIRRSALVYFNRPKAQRYSDGVVEYFAEELNWSAEEKERQQHRLRVEMDHVLTFDPTS